MITKSFYGEYHFVIDSKNRIFIPSKFRDELKKEKAKNFMITIGLDGCLYIFPPSTWNELLKNNMEVFKAENKEEERAFKRFFFSNASETEIDEQGRILISNSHKNFAHIKKEVVIIGAGNKIELWAKEKWEEYKNIKIKKSLEKFSKILDI
ncbi:MAG: division/cell wall cluster transcriptional repressor MraZ [Elusimicrobiales bacterium]|nr:division/cell wall cluster transcriptional repressor MraZ [Elusimicrobiales bacterium]